MIFKALGSSVTKSLLFIFMMLGFIACGGRIGLPEQKSSIKDYQLPERTAEAYGDGRYVIANIPLAITTDALDVPNFRLGGIEYIAGGIAKMFMNIGASLGLGKNHLTFWQPLPEIPTEYIKSAKLTRVFFYIEPADGGVRRTNWFKKIFRGQGDVNFNFINKLAFKISPEYKEFQYFKLIFTCTVGVTPEATKKEQEEENCQMPTPGTAEDKSAFNTIFRNKKLYDVDVDLSTAKDYVLLKYDGDRNGKFARTDDTGTIYLISTRFPADTLKYFNKRTKLGGKLNGIVKHAQKLDNMVVVELERGSVVEENFKLILTEEADTLEEMGVKNLDACTTETCLDIRVPDIDILPMLIRENTIRLDAFIDAGKVPEAFQLKGFINFEVKVDIPF